MCAQLHQRSQTFVVSGSWWGIGLVPAAPIPPPILPRCGCVRKQREGQARERQLCMLTWKGEQQEVLALWLSLLCYASMVEKDLLLLKSWAGREGRIWGRVKGSQQSRGTLDRWMTSLSVIALDRRGKGPYACSIGWCVSVETPWFGGHVGLETRCPDQAALLISSWGAV